MDLVWNGNYFHLFYKHIGIIIKSIQISGQFVLFKFNIDLKFPLYKFIFGTRNESHWWSFKELLISYFNCCQQNNKDMHSK